MGLFLKIKSKKNANTPAAEMPEEYLALSRLREWMESLLTADRYVAKSEYKTVLAGYEETVEYFGVLIRSDMLEPYCIKLRVEADSITKTISQYSTFEELVDKHNDEFLAAKMNSEKEYLDGILTAVDPTIVLDEDQRKVVLSDEDYTLVIAGAGAGKTTTVAAKVKYLVDKQQVDPRKILVISFTNKAVGELKDKINKGLGLDCPIATFHSTGNAILRKNSPEKLNIVEESKLYFVIQDYFRNSVLKNESMVNNLILFFASYFDAPYQGDDLNAFFNNVARKNYSTLRSDLDEFERQIVDARSRKSVTIQSEVMRSHQEVEIANFLYLNNIDYEYEPIYRYDIKYSWKPYTPDFIITQGGKTAYIEHFGITQDGRNNRYSEDQLNLYRRAINDKIRLHREHGTTLIYTFSAYNDNRPLMEHLREALEDKGFILSPRSNKEVLEKLLTTEENRYIRKFVSLICRFINNFKTNGYSADDFSRMYHSTTNVRSRLFLDICHECYLEYDRYLTTNNAVDFQDMINGSVKVLREVKEMGEKLDFDYIIVDEYQDISRQRFDLVTALHEVCDAKIVAVGDDWQSIYAFSGSDITLFTKFQEKMGYAKQLKIVNTYRNSQEVIDIAGNFIQKNEAQIKKDLVSPKNITDPVIIYTYDGKRKKPGGYNRSGANYAMALAVEKALDQIVEYNKSEGRKNTSVLLLGRYGFDGDHLEKSGLFEFVLRGSKIKSLKYPKMNITFMTAHASKGLGYDDVILVNGKNETFGFPCKIEDDPVLAFVIKGDRSIDYAEERRLFYVAMTRTKNRVYMVAPEQNPSEFLLEIKQNYKNVVLKGTWNEEPPKNTTNRKACPMCGYPMQYRYKNAYGLRLYICTNEPEVCGFMTNEIKAGKLCIMKCNQCRDGYLIAKPGKDSGYFLGCTNYKSDKSGCGNTIGEQMFYEMNDLSPDVVEDMPVARPVIKPMTKPAKNPVTKINTESLKVAQSEVRYQTATVEPPPPVANKRVDPRGKVFFDNYDLYDVVSLVLICLNHISDKHYYGVLMLADVLRGADQAKIRSRELDKVSEYASLSNLKREYVLATIYWLIENHYILRTKEWYPVLHPTNEGMHYADNITAGQLKKLKAFLESEDHLISLDNLR